MFALRPLLLLVVVAAIVAAVVSATRHRPAHAEPAPSAPAGAPLAGAPLAGEPPARAPRSAIAEALGYLGGMLALVGLTLVVGHYWRDMATPVRLALAGGAAVTLLAGGIAVHEGVEGALTRLRWSLWLGSTAAFALFAGVAAAASDASSTTVVLWGALAVTVESAALWRGGVRPVQQLTALVGLAVVAGTFAAEFDVSMATGFAVVAVGGAYVLAGVRGWTSLPRLTAGVGAATMVVGSVLVAADDQTIGFPFTVAAALGLVALAVVPGLVDDRSTRLELGIIGGVALSQNLPPALAYFAQQGGLATGLITWVAGAALVIAGSRHLVRVPTAVQAGGCIAMIGGAAITGATSPGFATMFGIATGIGLIAAGMVPGRLLFSLFGSLGLLINVPWAIGWFFPGENRAPLLIFVSGALILAIALVIARTGGHTKGGVGGLGGHGGAPAI
ncbi:MAG TPA: hypothetical protein VHN98_05530 [Acidimicrobiales bacterium]|nr:hypothetical protein [Acidimicrobiales bacterium]